MSGLIHFADADGKNQTPVSSANPLPVSGGTGASASQVQGNAASGATDAGSPVKIGGVYNSTPPTIATGQRGDVQIGTRGSMKVQLHGADLAAAVNVATTAVDGGSTSQQTLWTSAYGYVFNGSTWDRQRGDANGAVSTPHALPSSRWNYAGVTGGITDTSDVAIIAAGGAAVRNYLTGLQFINTTATASEIVIKDGATVIWRGYASASMTMMEKITFDVPLRGTANTALNVALLTTATATRVSAQGYQGV